MSNELLNIPYDFIDNGNGELMLIMNAVEGNVDDENARFVYDEHYEAKLYRDSERIIRISVPEPCRELLSKIEKLLVTEMDGDDIADVYEASVESRVWISKSEWPSEYKNL